MYHKIIDMSSRRQRSSRVPRYYENENYRFGHPRYGRRSAYSPQRPDRHYEPAYEPRAIYSRQMGGNRRRFTGDYETMSGDVYMSGGRGDGDRRRDWAPSRHSAPRRGRLGEVIGMTASCDRDAVGRAGSLSGRLRTRARLTASLRCTSG